MMELRNLIAVALGGMLGSLLRYAVNDICRQHLPAWSGLGTLLVNLTGCFAIGWVLAPRENLSWLSESVRLFLVTGVLGGLTTFSSFAHETVDLWTIDQRSWSFGFCTANLGLGLISVIAGRWLAGTVG